MSRGTVVFERGEHVYLVAPVAPFQPTENDIDELAFAEDLRKMAPNEHLLWLRGQYVESEKANLNGHYWASDQLEIASLTPMFMPVTVMHDPRTAVGLIADAKLLERDGDKVPRSRIDTTLGVWKHRFPEVAAEIEENYKAGSLMQSMECRPAYYDCGECGQRFPKLPGSAEVANWCEHLKAKQLDAANTLAVRRLGNVTFTGTGLIFGSRGATGANEDANLEVFAEEVAEFHERQHQDARRSTPRRARKMDDITIPRNEYDSLKAKADRSDELERRLSEVEPDAAKVPDLEQKIEETETAKTAAEDRAKEAEKKVETHEEEARKQELAKDRLGKLGKGFTAKLGEFTRGRLDEQAGAYSEEEWENRLKELEESAGVKRDDGTDADADADTDTVTRDDTARSRAGGGGGNGGNGTAPGDAERKSVIGGLAKQAAGAAK